jgi:hypothetical protein
LLRLLRSVWRLLPVRHSPTTIFRWHARLSALALPNPFPSSTLVLFGLVKSSLLPAAAKMLLSPTTTPIHLWRSSPLLNLRVRRWVTLQPACPWTRRRRLVGLRLVVLACTRANRRRKPLELLPPHPMPCLPRSWTCFPSPANWYVLRAYLLSFIFNSGSGS